jgi:uncharacterized damage-inducible protein DinB
MQEQVVAFRSIRAPLQELIAKIPEEKGGFSAWSGGMTITQLVDHLINSGNRMVGRQAEAAQSKSLGEARAALDRNTEEVSELLASLSQAQLQETVEALGRKLTRGQLLGMQRVHESHHKGQLWMMARMVGVEPPFFFKTA